MKRASYCILNKEYSVTEYETLKEKIIEVMKERGEWGEFFPAELSPFKLEESIAEEWFEDIVPSEINLKNRNENGCINCGKGFRVLKEEASFYKKRGVPEPKRCPYCRHKGRVRKLKPRKLWSRECSNCELSIKSSCLQASEEKILCGKCYLKSVY